jgi:hypothetical protein
MNKIVAAILTVALFIVFYAPLAILAEDTVESNSVGKKAEFPMGLLGYPLGTYLTIEGQYNASEKNKLRHRGVLDVDTVNDKKLDKTIYVIIKNVDIDSLPNGTRYIFKGYETGCFIGTPHEVAKATKKSEQALWQFQHEFIVTSILSPDSLKKEF